MIIKLNNVQQGFPIENIELIIRFLKGSELRKNMVHYFIPNEMISAITCAINTANAVSIHLTKSKAEIEILNWSINETEMFVETGQIKGVIFQVTDYAKHYQMHKDVYFDNIEEAQQKWAEYVKEGLDQFFYYIQL